MMISTNFYLRTLDVVVNVYTFCAIKNVVVNVYTFYAIQNVVVNV